MLFTALAACEARSRTAPTASCALLTMPCFSPSMSAAPAATISPTLLLMMPGISPTLVRTNDTMPVNAFEMAVRKELAPVFKAFHAARATVLTIDHPALHTERTRLIAVAIALVIIAPPLRTTFKMAAHTAIAAVWTDVQPVFHSDRTLTSPPRRMPIIVTLVQIWKAPRRACQIPVKTCLIPSHACDQLPIKTPVTNLIRPLKMLTTPSMTLLIPLIRFWIVLSTTLAIKANTVPNTVPIAGRN